MQYNPDLKENDPCPSCKIGSLRWKESKWGEFLGCKRFPRCAWLQRPKKEIDPLEAEADRILREAE